MCLFLDEKSDVELIEKIQVIKNEITRLKSTISELMKEKYVELEPYLKPDEILVDKSEKLVSKLLVLQDNIENEVKMISL